jgi:predicted DsbA family dithiol-disulfide isomerase
MDDDAGYWEHTWKDTSSELRGFIAAAAARQQGETAFRSFHDSLETAVHEQLLELGDESTLIGVAEQAGLDLMRFKSGWRDPALALEARRSHENANREHGIFGTPTILFPDEQAIHTELVEDIPIDRALKVFHHITSLGYEHPYISKLERITKAL